MSNVDFQEDSVYQYSSGTKKSKGLTGLVRSWGLARTEEGATRVLILIVVIATIGAIFVVYFTSPARTRTLTNEQKNRLLEVQAMQEQTRGNQQ